MSAPQQLTQRVHKTWNGEMLQGDTMYRSTPQAPSGLGEVLNTGKWKVTITPGAGAGWLDSGADVDARLRLARSWVQRHGGAVTDDTGWWSNSNVDMTFTLPGSANWDMVWAVPERDLTWKEEIAEGAKDALSPALDEVDQRAQERMEEAQRRAEAASEKAKQDAQEVMREADARAEARIEQSRNAMILTSVIGISVAAVVYITVSPSK